MDGSLQSFDSHGEDPPLFLARSWAETTMSLLRTTRKRRRSLVAAESAHERMDVEGLTWGHVQAAFGDAWAAESLLAVAASQFEVWLGKLYESRGRSAPERLPYLRELRNSVVHLDEAVINPEDWTATAGTRQGERFGIGALPGAELSLWRFDHSHLLGVIPFEAIEEHVNRLLDELAAELDDYARDWLDMVRSGR